MKKLAYLLKTSKTLYNIYYYVVSFILRILGLFIRIDDKLILFNSYGGKKYDDSPKAIYEAMLADDRWKEYRLIWAFQEPHKVLVPEGTKIVKCDTLAYFCMALKARVWVTNSSMERGLSFKKKGTFCFNTWHGSALKNMGVNIKSKNAFKGNGKVCADVMLAQSQYDIDMFSRALEIPKENFRLIGLPRNDELIQASCEKVKSIKEKLKISPEKTVLLYAPTFRESINGKKRQVIDNVPINVEQWKEKLGDDYVILFRAHYEVAKYSNICDGTFFRDVSDYPNLNELMLASDALISDYSSIYMDYAIMHKPMHCYGYDYKEYKSTRGFHFDLENDLPCKIHLTEDSLLEELCDGNTEKHVENVKEFQKVYVMAYGEATKKSCDIIYAVMN